VPGRFLDLGPFDVPGFPPRAARVYEPAGAEGQLRPALVVFDGQNAFDDRPGTPGWHLHRAVDALDDAHHLRPRLLAIPHGGASRADELTAWPVTGYESPGGRGDSFLDWLVTSLVPAFRARFPTPEGALGLAIGGASWGASHAIRAHFRHPHVFGGALALSPAVWVGDFALPRWLDAQPTPTFSRIYLDCGALEAEGRMLPPAAKLAQQLEARGYSPGQLRFVADPRGEHTELHWRRRLPEALRFLYRLS
jgi:enterochelin esterase-like enzyme